MCARGIKPLFGARPVKLIHELRRLESTATVESYFYGGKKWVRPHGSDKVGAELVERSEDVLCWLYI